MLERGYMTRDAARLAAAGSGVAKPGMRVRLSRNRLQRNETRSIAVGVILASDVIRAREAR